MILSEYIQIVRALLESMPAPEVVLIDNDEGADLKSRIVDAIEDLDIPIGFTFYRYFDSFNPACFNDEFKELAKDSIPWAFWKVVVIPEFIRNAMTHYFEVQPVDCDIEAWHRLAKLILESVFSAKWPADMLKMTEDCSICTEPLSRPIHTPCGHKFHFHCLEEWMKRNISCPLCRAVL